MNDMNNEHLLVQSIRLAHSFILPVICSQHPALHVAPHSLLSTDESFWLPSCRFVASITLLTHAGLSLIDQFAAFWTQRSFGRSTFSLLSSPPGF